MYQVESSPSLPVLVIYFLTFSKEHFHDLQINIFNIFQVLRVYITCLFSTAGKQIRNIYHTSQVYYVVAVVGTGVAQLV